MRLVDPPKAACTARAFSDGGVGEDVAGPDAAIFHLDDGAAGAAGQIAPDLRTGGAESGMGQGEAEGLGDDLAGGGGAEELAAASGRAAGLAAHLGGIFSGDSPWEKRAPIV
jgi:hypothetical protein